MLLVAVHVQVKPECVQAFVSASKLNAEASRKEPGVAQFDVCQMADAPTRFLLVEVYRRSEDQLAHRETAHYKVWRDAVADMMAEPRNGVKYTVLA